MDHRSLWKPVEFLLRAVFRRMLSRESDAILEAQAKASEGAVLVSFWRQTGMSADTGTPTEWLSNLSDQIVHIHCASDPETAARRFFERQRHPGHLDATKSYADVLTDLRALSRLELLGIGPMVTVDASQALRPEDVVHAIRSAFRRFDA